MASHNLKLKLHRQQLKLNMVQTCLWQGVVGINRDGQTGNAVMVH
jgi:hypothetical protein